MDAKIIRTKADLSRRHTNVQHAHAKILRVTSNKEMQIKTTCNATLPLHTKTKKR